MFALWSLKSWTHSFQNLKHWLMSFSNSTKHAIWHEFEQIKLEERFKTKSSFKRTQSTHFKHERKRKSLKNELFEKLFESVIETSWSTRTKTFKKHESSSNEQKIAQHRSNSSCFFSLFEWYHDSHQKTKIQCFIDFFFFRSSQWISTTSQKQNI